MDDWDFSALDMKKKQHLNSLSLLKHNLLQTLNMNRFAYLGKKLHPLFHYSCCKTASFIRFSQAWIEYIYRFLVSQVHPLFLHLGYFTIISLLGYLALKVSKPRTFPIWPNDLDLFFTSVSASTVSSLSVVVMEVLSNNQLIIITIIMLLGGEVFTSMLGLLFAWFKKDSVNYLKHNSIRYLGYVVLSYMILILFVGCIMVFTYLSIVPSAKEILRNKDLKIHTFLVFTVVSTFTNCGFVPTNENMIVFKKSSGLLLLLIPFALLGNTVYPPCLRLVIRTLGKYSKREEFFYMLKNHREMGYYPLLSGFHCFQLAITVFLLFATQLLLFCFLEWNSENLKGLHFLQKLVALLFQSVNSRHAGETVLDLSTVDSAMMVLIIVMMYMAPYTRFLPIRDVVEDELGDDDGDNKNDSQRAKWLVESVVLSQMSYIVIFIIIICITERDKLRRDPLNFNLLTITTKVISAYGNVGFSTGYSCERQLEPNFDCKHRWTGLARHFSSKGKVMLILVMFFGKLKRFSRNRAKPWLLS